MPQYQIDLANKDLYYTGAVFPQEEGVKAINIRADFPSDVKQQIESKLAELGITEYEVVNGQYIRPGSWGERIYARLDAHVHAQFGSYEVCWIPDADLLSVVHDADDEVDVSLEIVEKIVHVRKAQSISHNRAIPTYIPSVGFITIKPEL